MPAEHEPTSDPDQVYEALKLVAAAAGNADDVRRALAQHPSVLSPTGVMLAHALGGIQTSVEGRSAGRELALLIDLCAKHGIDEGLERFRARVPKLRAEARLQAARQAAIDDARQPVEPIAVPDWARALTDRPVTSLRDCIEEMRAEARSANATSRPTYTSPSGVQRVTPAFLYRGESGMFGESRSSLARLMRDRYLSEKAFEQILMVTDTARSMLIDRWRLDRLESSAFLQHYGLPTDWIDLTEDLGVAASFGANLHVGELGAIASFPIQPLFDGGDLVNLSHRSIADRPRRQHAWAFSSAKYRDLKDPLTIRALDIRWRVFRIDEEDLSEFCVDPALLDGHSDPVAGVLQIVVDGAGKLDDSAAQWLSLRLEPAPFVGIVMPDRQADGSPRIRLVSADEAGMPYDRGAGRSRNYQTWSESSTSPPRKELSAELRDALVSTDSIQPGDLLHILSWRGLSALRFPDDAETTV